MTNVNADRLALRDADAVRPAPPDKRRPSFEPHIRQREPAKNPASHVDGDAFDDAARPRTGALQREDTKALPLASTDAVFGEGAKIYPQALAVVGYLSMLPNPDEAGTPYPEGLKAASGAVMGAASVPQTDSRNAAPATPAEPSPHELFPGAVHDARHPGPVPDGEADPVHTSIDATEIGAWLQRRLTFSGKGANATLRLRDYRLARSEHEALVGQLVSMAKDQGWPVARIVVNGREIWRQSGAASPHHLPGGEPHVG